LAPRNDIAIYSPFAFAFYEDPASKAARQGRGGGGAELQTTLLAKELARLGFKVAHIVYPIESPAPLKQPSPEVVERLSFARRRGLRGRAAEALGIWRALAAADARVYIFRTGLSGGITAFTIGAAFCLLRRRQLVLSASNDLDFVFDRDDRPRRTEVVYRLALRRTSRVVVQTESQVELARRAPGDGDRIALIPSFAEVPESAPSSPEPDAFLWASRVVDYKLPLRYIELARALPEAKFRMVGAQTGETPAELMATVKGAAAELPNLELLPTVPRGRVLELIGRSRAVVLTSRHEGMPNVFLEAWARGRPVLSLHFDPDGKIAKEGLGLCAEGSWELFIDAARRLWDDRELRAELGENGRGYVARIHSVEAVGARWAATLRVVLDT
jgi:glycosyltransferase involved in cell wall biosynthesis